MYQEIYPKTKYHVRGGGSIVVTSAAQDKALGSEWLDVKPIQTITQDVTVTEAPKIEGPRPNQQLNEAHRRSSKR